MVNLIENYRLKVYKPKYLSPKSNEGRSIEKLPQNIASSNNLLLEALKLREIAGRTKVQIENTSIITKPWVNDLKTLFKANKAVIWALVPRTFNAKDTDGSGLIRGNEEQGTFYNAIEKLDELKRLGVNTIHVLPPHPVGEGHTLNPLEKAQSKPPIMGTAGSVYAPIDFLNIDPKIGGKEGFKKFNEECHRRNIRVMVDLPSCASLELFKARKDLMAFERDGLAKVPQGWEDIRMFNPWADETKRILNPNLLELHKKYVDMCIELGVDGIRADVARAKPTEFWDILIPYSQTKDPNFAWLAETYTYEDASPQANMPYDRPEDLLRAGFDMIYGQYHIFHDFENAKAFNDYVIENLEMSNRLEKGKTLLGSFATHDDISPMFNGGMEYCNLTTALQATLPMLNPYFIDGFSVGDYYVYPYAGLEAAESQTINKKLQVHHGKLDIFNLSRAAKGNNPEIGDYMAQTMQVRKNYENILTKGSFIPLQVNHNEDDKIIAFIRHLNGKSLLVIANKDVNLEQDGVIEIPGLLTNQQLLDLLPKYGQNSMFQISENGKLKVNLGRARAHMFEINTPNIEKANLKVYKQNL